MTNQNSDRLSEILAYRRRTIVRAVGTGVGMATVGTSGVYATEQHDDEDDEDGANDEDDDGPPVDDAGGDVHPVFGFSAESDAVEPPVEPDHEVSLVAEQRDEAEIPFPEWFFDPVGLSVEPGDTVRFTLESPFHTVTAYHSDLGFTQRVPEGVGVISSPVLWEGAYFLYTFDEPGVYDLQCLPHEWAGMVIRVVAGEATGPGAEEVPEPAFEEGQPETGAELSPDWLAAQVFRDPAMDPENIVEQGQVAWDDLDPESKEFPMDLLMPMEAESLTAVLSGSQETEDVETNASGCAHFTPAEGGLGFTLVLEDIGGATQAHIHEGGRDEDGPVVAPLLSFTEEVDGGGEGEPRDAAPDEPIVERGLVEDEALVEEILADPSAFYVNVHTIEYPAGEIRGQIRSTGAPEEPADGEQPRASVAISDQDSDGTSVVVDRVELSEGGFATIHDETLETEVDPIGSVVGVSDVLEPGEHENVDVQLYAGVPGADFEADASLQDGDRVIAMPHIDTNDDGEYDFVTSEGAEDGPYVGEEGNPVIDDATVTVDGATDDEGAGDDGSGDDDNDDSGNDNGDDGNGDSGNDDNGDGNDDY